METCYLVLRRLSHPTTFSAFRGLQPNSKESFMRVPVSLLGAACVAALVSYAASASVVEPGADELVPTGKGWGERPAPGAGPGNGAGQGQGEPQGQARAARPQGTNGINYHGGPVMTGTKNI